MKTKRYAKPKEDWVINQSEELRLIADDVWETAQKNRLQNQRVGFGFGPKRAAYLLTGLFHCSVCGNSAGGHWQVNRNGKRYYYYRCRASMNGGKSCANKSKIRGEQIESAIIAKIEAELFSKIFFEKVIDAAMKILEADRLGESVEMLAEKIKALDTQISNMTRAIAVAPDVVELAQRMATLNAERQTLQIRLAQSKRSCAPDRADLSRRWAEVAGKTLSLLKSGADVARLRTELMKWIDAVRLDQDGRISIKWKASTIFENLDLAGLAAADFNQIADLQEWRALYLSDAPQN